MGTDSERTRAAYDLVARDYDEHLSDELAGKPLDRALLAAFVELVGATGTLADVGCGPGHVTSHLATLREPGTLLGVDLSPGMVAVAHERHPDIAFEVGSMLALPTADAAWAGAIALYSVIHLTDDERPSAYREFARAIRPGGYLLVSFHVDDADHQMGEADHVTQWWGHDVDVDFHFLDPEREIASLSDAGFTLTARLDRAPHADAEHPSRRTYLVAQRPG